jgi:RNA polymerase I-specific transcription initiation factor RRN11
MFELALVDVQESDSKKKHKHLERLLSKAVEVGEYNRIRSSSRLTKSQKTKLQTHKARKTILKKLHSELSKRHNPEETFEEWNSQDSVPANSEAALTKAVVSELSENENEDEASSASEDEVEKHLEEITSTFDQSSTWAKANFLIRAKGLEVFPHHDVPNGSEYGMAGDSRLKVGLKKTHAAHVTVLLHLNILRRNWNLAYKLFCLLIRVPDIDIRTIWPLGIEILSQKQREAPRSGNEPELYKDEKFFDWLTSFYSTRWHHKATTTYPSRRSAAPVWRSGSRTHAPLYVISSLWTLLVRRDFSKLNDKLSEMLLEPPYSTDGVFHFLLASSKLLEAFDLKQQYANTDDANHRSDLEAQIKKTIILTEKLLESCKQCNFSFPESEFRNEIDSIRMIYDSEASHSISTPEHNVTSHLDEGPSLPILDENEDIEEATYVDFSSDNDDYQDAKESLDHSSKADLEFDFEL